ncbi:hypothetical protein [Puerhibacterium puerhi]|uniref:hypothetical protein n=1 Tax=Puerhibacterium puerhi TaxID=2692623 RepID=UPI001358B32A|nr:hypothetical protein [Puerhibacterium puerhi]
MTHRSTADLRRRVFEEFAVIANRELGDKFEDLPVTASVVNEIAQNLGMLSTETGRAAQTKRSNARRTLRTWLADSDHYSPFIDEVAVRRAVEFTPGAYDALSDDERKEFVTRLIQHPDPFGQRLLLIEEVVRERWPNKQIRFGETPRFKRWTALPESERNRIRDAYDKENRRLRNLASEEAEAA